MRKARRMAWAVGFLSVAVLCAADAQAQQRKNQGGGRGGMMGMGGMVGPGIVALPAVQKELKLDDKQADEARAFAEAYRAKQQELMADIEGEGQDRFAKMQEVNAKHAATGMKEVEKMLKPEQTKRFKQIVFQARGTDGLTDPEVAKELSITPEQQEKVKGLIEASRSEMREAMQDAAGDRQAMTESMGKIRKATNAKALALMTPEQTAKYKELAGEPFELPAMGGGRPGGGNRN